MSKPKHYAFRTCEIEWPNPEMPKPWTRLVGPGLGLNDIYDVGEDNLQSILTALDAAYEAGKQARSREILNLLGGEARWR